MKIDILIAHPLKHHVYFLAAGCLRSGLSIRLMVPLYRKGLGAFVASLPGHVGRKAQGYHYDGLESSTVISPIAWQLKRLLTSSANITQFSEQFDAYVATRIRRGEVRPRVLVTMQDYMPATVAAGKEIGAIIWSDQILNQSIEARKRIDRHLGEFGIPSTKQKSEDSNDEILKDADIVTLPSDYTLNGVASRISAHTKIHRVPYGVNAKQFMTRQSRNEGVVRVLARANSIRKGGHLLMEAVQCCGEELRNLANGSNVEFIIVGTPDERLRRMVEELHFPNGVTVRAMVVPHVDMPALLASSDLFVMPSLSEGMSLICIEAMQAGLPLVITPYCGIDCFRHLEMGVEVTASVDSLVYGLITAFSRKSDWANWGCAARTAAEKLSWMAYEMQISDVAKRILSHS